MNEDMTRDLPQSRSFEERIFAELTGMRAELAQLNVRLTSLEEKVDRRLQETRPIWENVLADIKRMDTKLDQIVLDLYNQRTSLTLLTERVDRLERLSP